VGYKKVLVYPAVILFPLQVLDFNGSIQSSQNNSVLIWIFSIYNPLCLVLKKEVLVIEECLYKESF